MKEATGEANMTIVTVVLIGLVTGAAALLVPRLISGTKEKSCCSSAGGTWNGTGCDIPSTLPGGQAEYDDCIGDTD